MNNPNPMLYGPRIQMRLRWGPGVDTHAHLWGWDWRLPFHKHEWLTLHTGKPWLAWCMSPPPKRASCRLIEPTYITWRRHDYFCHLSCTACISLTSNTTHTTVATDPNKPVRPTYAGKFTHAPLACLPPPLCHAMALQPSILWLLQTLRIPLSMTISMPVHFLMILSTRLRYNATFSILMTSEQNTNSFAFAGTLQ